MTNEKITALENKGFKRWIKGDMDRMYIEWQTVDKWANTTDSDTCYMWLDRTERSRGKIWMDVKTGELQTKGIEEADKILAIVKAYIGA